MNNENKTVITRRETQLLDWFFERGDSLVYRSSFGTMLERQHAYGYAEDGRRVPKALRNGDGLRIKKKRQLDEASYMPDEDDLLRVAEVSRRLERVRSVDPDAALALTAYHGDLGARWSHVGSGRLFALYPLTHEGQQFLAHDAADWPGRGGPFERLALELAAQRTAPTAERAMLLARIHGQAENLIAKAWRLWSATKNPRWRAA
jgi:hypothetical protein